MKILKKFLGVLAFIIIFFALFTSITYMLRPLEGEEEEIRSRLAGFYAEETNTLDIITLGTSAIYRYINNPLLWEKYNLTSYNFASPGQSIFALEYMIDEVQKSQSPDLYIIETRKFLYTEETEIEETRFAQLVNNMKYSFNRIKMIYNLVDSWEERFHYFFDITLYHVNWENLTIDNIEYADNEKEHKLKGWRNINTIKNLEDVDVSDITDSSPISEVSEEALIELIEKCEKKKIEVLFVATPWQINEEYQKMNNYIQEIVEAHGFNFLNLNSMIKEMELDFSTDFYNNRHVNVFGAEKITSFLGKYISENYEIDKNHSEQTIAEWNEAMELNNAQMEALEEIEH